MLCATVRNESRKALTFAHQYADLIELSFNLFKPSNPENLRKLCHKPVIFKLNELDLDLLRLLPDYVDLPHTTPKSVFEKIQKYFPTIKRICSYHDYEKTEDLDERMSQLYSIPADLYKVATYANSTLDALQMLRCVKKYKCIGLCMGELGQITRILAPIFGAPWTYAPQNISQQTAEGQILLENLVKTYHYKDVRETTSIYGLIGDPISLSPSHHIHNFAFQLLGLDAIYVKMSVKKFELKDFFDFCHELGFKGLSVTMPLKKAVKKHLNAYKGEAINTLVFKNQKIFGCNTDGEGALNALEKKTQIVGKKIVLLGAGGVSEGIAKEAKKRGASLSIVNRTFARAKALAKTVEADAYCLASFSQVAKKGYDVLINCTSVGMGKDTRIPIPLDEILEKKIVMDVVLNPKITPFLNAAKQKKCEILNGMDMFIEQAVGQYCYWLDIGPLA